MTKLGKFLKKRRVKLIRLAWVDNANVIRNKAFSLEEMERYSTSGVSLSQAIQAVPVMGDCVIPEAHLPPTKDIWLKPDWLSMRLLSFAPGAACVMGRLVDQHHPWPLCPRQLLLNMMDSLFQKTGVQLKAAFENEFYLLNSDCKPVDQSLFASSYAVDSQHAFLMDLHDTLIKLDMIPEICHAEAGAGQFEYSIGHTDPLTAADNQILFRQAVHAIARQHGLHACFLPKISVDLPGSGSHLHFSFWRGEENITADEADPSKLNADTEHFLAGVLQHLPSLMALTTPTTNSFRRIQPGRWVGAYQAWGYDNREAAIRVPVSSMDKVEHIELKTVDVTANPYYALAGLIAVGLNGLESKMALPKPMDFDPAALSEAELQVKHIQRLPMCLSAAMQKFENHKVFLDCLGEPLFQSYVAVKKAELEFFENRTLAEEFELLRDRY